MPSATDKRVALMEVSSQPRRALNGFSCGKRGKLKSNFNWRFNEPHAIHSWHFTNVNSCAAPQIFIRKTDSYHFGNTKATFDSFIHLSLPPLFFIRTS